ncbi:hypothetical protein BD310DRAFT_978940 [Dichomitus squalens]|uniref:Uncharacterized protein n=1 Tax=Dichomitus squalens TaxID=114155 RepID=A0A4Q9PPQ9_9APHY|nr:hypothetical protein BD310DRAFT_978940 [Dichomitus squalens]
MVLRLQAFCLLTDALRADNEIVGTEAVTNRDLPHSAIFDRKDQLLDIPHDHRLALQRIGDRLEWILNNIENGSS